MSYNPFQTTQKISEPSNFWATTSFGTWNQKESKGFSVEPIKQDYFKTSSEFPFGSSKQNIGFETSFETKQNKTEFETSFQTFAKKEEPVAQWKTDHSIGFGKTNAFQQETKQSGDGNLNFRSRWDTTPKNQEQNLPSFEFTKKSEGFTNFSQPNTGFTILSQPSTGFTNFSQQSQPTTGFTSQPTTGFTSQQSTGFTNFSQPNTGFTSFSQPSQPNTGFTNISQPNTGFTSINLQEKEKESFFPNFTFEQTKKDSSPNSKRFQSQPSITFESFQQGFTPQKDQNTSSIIQPQTTFSQTTYPQTTIPFQPEKSKEISFDKKKDISENSNFNFFQSKPQEQIQQNIYPFEPKFEIPKNVNPLIYNPYGTNPILETNNHLIEEEYIEPIQYKPLSLKSPIKPLLRKDNIKKEMIKESKILAPIIKPSIKKLIIDDQTFEDILEKENKDSQIEKKSENNLPKLTKEYYTKPSVKELNSKNLIVKDFIIGNSFGEIQFLGNTDLTGLNLDEIIIIKEKCVEVYPEDKKDIQKPKVGEINGLNKPAIVKIKKFFPKENQDQTKFQNSIQKTLTKKGSNFISYHLTEGILEFQVNHF